MCASVGKIKSVLHKQCYRTPSRHFSAILRGVKLFDKSWMFTSQQIRHVTCVNIEKTPEFV